MDFTTTEAAQDLGGLVDTIVDAVCTPEHQRELDKLEQRFDRELWRKLIDAGILSSAAPESLGGDGFGVLEQVAVLVALGHQLAAVPYLESVVLAAVGMAPITLDPDRISVSFNGAAVCVHGVGAPGAREVDLSDADIDITVDLGVGDGQARIRTTDLSHAYVEENSAYSS